MRSSFFVVFAFRFDCFSEFGRAFSCYLSKNAIECSDGLKSGRVCNFNDSGVLHEQILCKRNAIMVDEIGKIYRYVCVKIAGKIVYVDMDMFGDCFQRYIFRIM